MSVNKITNVYTAKDFSNGDALGEDELDALSQAAHDAQVKLNEIIDEIANLSAGGGGGSSSGGGSTPSGVVSVSSKGNTTVSATKNINIEPAYVANGGSGTYGDVQIKPGDDITLESHHRPTDKRDEITIKTSDGVDGSKAPVKMQVIASNLTLSTKGKVVPQGSNDTPEVMNINVTTGQGKGYLKVRARAIDLRCEEHGGIALQPMGSDGQGHENKVKFEHGGGDGKEFFTMNSEKMSAFVEEYRFNKRGVWKMSNRTLLDNTNGAGGNDKYDPQSSDETQHFSYEKQADDFYDKFEADDETCTTRDIIQTAAALNGNPCIHAKITNKGALEIATTDKYLVVQNGNTSLPQSYILPRTQGAAQTCLVTATFVDDSVTPVVGEFYSLAEIKAYYISQDVTSIEHDFPGYHDGDMITIGRVLLQKLAAPDIKIDSGKGLKLGGILDFGSTFNFGETDGGIEVQYKLTKKNATKDCGMLRVVGVNNHATNSLTVEGVTVDPGDPATPIAECSILDIIKAVNWMKDNNQGPWANTNS